MSDIPDSGVLPLPMPPGGDYKDHRLWGFEKNKWDVRQGHTSHLNWLADFIVDDLDERIRSKIAGQAWTITLEGYASKTGPEDWNVTLSERRALAIEVYLKDRLVDALMAKGLDPLLIDDALTFKELTCPGSSNSTSAAEDAHWRAVRVTVHRPNFLPAPTPSPHPTEVQVPGVPNSGVLDLELGGDNKDYQDHRLWGFEKNKWDIQPGHTSHLNSLALFIVEDLDKRIKTKIEGQAWTITLEGYASKTGPEDWNVTLSQKRALAIEVYLNDRVVEALTAKGHDPFLLEDALAYKKRTYHGSSSSADTGEDPHWRAVRAVVHRPHLTPPPAPPPVPHVTPMSTTFGIQVMRAVGVALPIPKVPAMSPQADLVWMEVIDTTNHVRARYCYIGYGVNLGLPEIPKVPWLSPVLSPPVSLAPAGDPFYFSTSKPMAAWEFGGEARLSSGPTVSIPWKTVSLVTEPTLEFLGREFQDRGRPTSPKFIKLQGDTATWGISAFTDTMGQLIHVP